VPERVKTATENYRQEQDPLAEFLSERCILGDGCYVGATPLWGAYQEWAKENGEKWPVHRKDFVVRIRAKGCIEVRDPKTNRKAWRGIGLLTTNPEPSEPSEPKIAKVELVSSLRESLPKQGSEGSDGSELTREGEASAPWDAAPLPHPCPAGIDHVSFWWRPEGGGQWVCAECHPPTREIAMSGHWVTVGWGDGGEVVKV